MKKPKKILFSEKYNIKDDPRTFDFIDIYINGDSKFFVDAAKIKYASTQKSEYQYLYLRMQETIDNFFNCVLKMYQSLGGESDLDLKANAKSFARIFGNGGETQSTHFGYGKVGSSGKGSSPKILKEAFDYVYVEKLHELGLVKDIEELTLFTDNFSYDRMSDFIISLIVPEIAEFTMIQAKKYGIGGDDVSQKPIKVGYSWDKEREEWVLFKHVAVLDHLVKPVLLIPLNIMSRKFLYDPDDYLSYSLFRRQEEYKAMESPLNTVRKDGSIKPPPHSKIKEVEITEQNLSTKRYLIKRTLQDKGLKPSFQLNLGNVVANNASVLTVDEIEAYRLADAEADAKREAEKEKKSKKKMKKKGR